MKKHYIIILFVSINIALFFSCNSSIEDGNSKNKTVIETIKYNKYKCYSEDSLLMLDVTISQDSIKGEQCFSSVDGQKTDCCIDETSINLKLDKDNKYQGKMKSCYTDTTLAVEIILLKDTVTLLFLNDDHEFLPKKNKLVRSGK